MILPNWFPALLFIVVPLIGCGSQPADTQDQEAPSRATPREVFADFQHELFDGDIDAALAHASGSQEALDSLRVLHAYAGAVVEFRDRMSQTYGKDGWQAFNDSDGASLSMVDTTPLTAEQIEGLPVILEESSVAFVWDAKEKEWIRFHLIEDQWRLDANAYFTDEELEQVRLLSRITKVLKANLNQIGKEGVTPETLDQKIAGEMLATFLQTSQ